MTFARNHALVAGQLNYLTAIGKVSRILFFGKAARKPGDAYISQSFDGYTVVFL